MNITHIDGKKIKKVFMYALSTCIWCKKTKSYLNELGIEYDYIDVDLLSDKDKESTKEELKKWNSSCSYPTLVIDDKKCIKGYEPGEIREELGL